MLMHISVQKANHEQSYKLPRSRKVNSVFYFEGSLYWLDWLNLRVNSAVSCCHFSAFRRKYWGIGIYTSEPNHFGINLNCHCYQIVKLSAMFKTTEDVKCYGYLERLVNHRCNTNFDDWHKWDKFVVKS